MRRRARDGALARADGRTINAGRGVPLEPARHRQLERYVTRLERERLVSLQAGLGRASARHGALIPIRKNPAWWALTQEERRAIFEDRSQHIAVGLRALPQVARRLHHCRDLAEPQGFDFLTWFDFDPRDAGIFDEMLGALRRTEEWSYVDREVEIRVERVEG